MNSVIEKVIRTGTESQAKKETYRGPDGLLYCAVCHNPLQCIRPEISPDPLPCTCECDQLKEAAEKQAQEQAGRCEAVKNAPVIKCNALYSQQYYIKNNNGLDLNVESAWITSNLSNIKVAVVDRGVFNNHEDMSK